MFLHGVSSAAAQAAVASGGPVDGDAAGVADVAFAAAAADES